MFNNMREGMNQFWWGLLQCPQNVNPTCAYGCCISTVALLIKKINCGTYVYKLNVKEWKLLKIYFRCHTCFKL